MTSYSKPEALVETAWLAANLGAPDLRVVDASWHLAASGRDARAEYRERHIPGAVYFDIDAIADRESDLPHMLPGAEDFSQAVGAMGISNADRVVVYDTLGLFSAGRVWWMFRVFGHARVAVLNGGLPKWLREGRETESGESAPAPAVFRARLDKAMVRTLDDIRANLRTRSAQVLDARSRGRFEGSEPEPRAGLRPGHIPGSLNLPYGALVEAERGTVLDAEALKRAFVEAGVDLSRPVITTCGSGVTAAVLALGLHLLGHEDVAVYDGSWSEWGGRGDTPVEP